MNAGYVFTKDEEREVRRVLGGIPFGASVQRPADLVGSLPVLIEWLQGLSKVLEGVGRVNQEAVRELDARRRDDEAIQRFLARVLPGGGSRPDRHDLPDAREVAKRSIQLFTGNELDAAVQVYATFTGQTAYQASRELGLVTE